MKWVRRNEDKPHRCPECHGIALRAFAGHERGYGPRTVMRCPYECDVRWRIGTRAKRPSQRTQMYWREWDLIIPRVQYKRGRRRA